MKRIPFINILLLSFVSFISSNASCETRTSNDSLRASSDSAAITLVTQQFYQTLSFENSDFHKYDSLITFFIKQGLLISTVGKEPQLFTVDQYIEGAKINFVKQQISGWHESEICEKTDVFGKVAQRFSAYKITLMSNGQESVRSGINSIQFIKQDGRWLVTVVSWDKETEAVKIPDTYLCK